MSRPPYARNYSPSSFVRVNGKIRAREVRVLGTDGSQLGVFPLNEAITLARNQGVDLVEIASQATPPVCRLVDYGKYRYEQSKKVKETKRHQHANKVKEIQLSATIDANDFSVKLGHAIDFLCEEMKVKITLRFRGREMAHQEFGFQVVGRFINELTPYGHPDAAPRLIGKGLNVMLSPLPRNKRAKNPRQDAATSPTPAEDEVEDQVEDLAEDEAEDHAEDQGVPQPASPDLESHEPQKQAADHAGESDPNQFSNTPFVQLDIKLTK